MEGRFQHINSGFFQVYALEGTMPGLDTIYLENSRLAYQHAVSTPTTFVIIFPNFSEQPVFAEPGKKVTIKGDASHLREMEVKGTHDNELMNSIRPRLASSSPEERIEITKTFITDNPKSRVGIYLLSRYVIQAENPDYKLAAELVKTLLDAQPRDGYLVRLSQQLETLSKTTIGCELPKGLEAMALDSTKVDFSKIREADVAVINLWASWNVASMTSYRKLNQLRKQSKGKLQMLSISVDGKCEEARQALAHDTIESPVVCDELMFQSPLIDSLAFTTIPDNIVMEHGKIVARSLPIDQLETRLNELLGK